MLDVIEREVVRFETENALFCEKTPNRKRICNPRT